MDGAAYDRADADRSEHAPPEAEEEQEGEGGTATARGLIVEGSGTWNLSGPDRRSSTSANRVAPSTLAIHGSSPAGVEDREGHDGQEAGEDEQRSSDEPAAGAVQQPAQVDGELLGFWPGEECSS